MYYYRFSGDKSWSAVGHVIKIPDNFGDEVGLELKSNNASLPATAAANEDAGGVELSGL